MILERFLSQEGTIGRSEFLVGICALVGAGLVLDKLVYIALASVAQLVAIGAGNAGAQALAGIMFGLPLLVALYGTPVYFLACIYPLFCLIAKRNRDRDRAEWVAIIYTIALLLPTAIQMMKLLTGIIGLEILPQVFVSHAAVQLSIAVLLVWALVDLCLLRGRTISQEVYG